MNHEEKRIYITDVYAEEVKFINLKNPAQSFEKLADFELPDLLMEKQ